MSISSCRRTSICIAATFTLFFLGGCGAIASRQPIYDPNARTIVDDRLAGTWRNNDGTVQIRQWRCGYVLSPYTPDPSADANQVPPLFDLVRLGKYELMFMAMPLTSQAQTNIGTLLFPCYRVDFTHFGNILRLRMLDTLYLSEYLEDHPGVLKFEELNALNDWQLRIAGTQPSTQRVIKNIELTDEPARIRRFLIEHADDPGFFVDALELHRVSQP